MRFSHSLLLASVAILALPSCSSAKGPGEIGSKNDIVVRNFGDAPPPPSEEMLMQEPATPPEMMAARTLQGDVPEIDDSEARALAAQHEAEVAQQAPQADAVQAQMQAAQQAEIAAQRQAEQLQPQTPTEQYAQEVQQGFQQQAGAEIPRAPEPTQMQRQAMEAQQQQIQQQLAPQQGGMEAVPAPVVNAAPTLAEQATQTMPVQDQVEAAVDSTRTGVAAQGQATAEVLSQPVAQAATEYQAQPVDQAAQQALQNPPVSTVNVLQEQQIHQQHAPAPQPVQQPVQTVQQPAPQQAAQAAPVVASSVPTTTARIPTAEEIAAGGVRVVITERGTPVIGNQLVPPTPSPQPAPAPVAPAPVPTPAAAISLGDASMLTRAQTVLAQKGFYNGPADGKMSTELMNALSRYQSANYLTPGLLNEETARHMGLIQ